MTSFAFPEAAASCSASEIPHESCSLEQFSLATTGVEHPTPIPSITLARGLQVSSCSLFHTFFLD